MSRWHNEAAVAFEARLQRVFQSNMRIVDIRLRLSGCHRLLRSSRALVSQSRRALLG
jgi:hypothetical protein